MLLDGLDGIGAQGLGFLPAHATLIEPSQIFRVSRSGANGANDLRFWPVAFRAQNFGGVVEQRRRCHTFQNGELGARRDVGGAVRLFSHSLGFSFHAILAKFQGLPFGVGMPGVLARRPTAAPPTIAHRGCLQEVPFASFRHNFRFLKHQLRGLGIVYCHCLRGFKGIHN